MDNLPNFNDHWEHYNNFHFTSEKRQIKRILSHFELYKMVRDVPGEIVECGVFKGASLIRFAMFREMYGETDAKELLGFDTFGKFPEPEFEPDKEPRKEFIEEAGEESISTAQLEVVFENKGVGNYKLVPGDVNETIPKYVQDNPELRISLLNVDLGIYEPTKKILEYFYPRIVSGGVIIFDNYAKVPGDTKAVDEYFSDKGIEIKRLPFSQEAPYAIKK